MHIRRAGPLDSRAMADLLNDIIAIGGTTAITTPVSAQDLTEWMAAPGAIWHLAEDDTGQIMGFQWVEPKPTLPKDWLDIATFARVGATGLGIGSALFEQTKQAARASGGTHIKATIRADNSGGLAYYQSRNFERYGTEPNCEISPGFFVDRVKMRYEL